jgi:hypothetical protein
MLCGFFLSQRPMGIVGMMGWAYLQFGFGEGDVDDFAKGDEGVVKSLRVDLGVETADEDGVFLSGWVGHGEGMRVEG